MTDVSKQKINNKQLYKTLISDYIQIYSFESSTVIIKTPSSVVSIISTSQLVSYLLPFYDFPADTFCFNNITIVFIQRCYS